jgi:hypothetical protein
MKYFVLAILCCVAVVGCSSDKPTKPVEAPAAVYARDFVHAPDSSVVLRVAIRRQSNIHEPFLEEEAIIGEPFTDMNGNGQFDVGIDQFLRTYDPLTNQDLNYNGAHDGPENMSWYDWEPGIPFDDLDGNGTLRPLTGNMIPDVDCKYAPFIDWNGNGVWDSAVAVADEMHHFITTSWLEYTDIEIGNWSEGNYEFVSDSGLTYTMSLNHWPSSPGFKIRSGPDSIVVYKSDLTFLIADTGRMTNELGTKTLVYKSNGSLYASRHVVLDTSLQFDDTLLQGLLYIGFDSVRTDLSLYPQFAGDKWEFFFDRQIGLIAYRKTDDWSDNPETFYFHQVWTGTFPLPMTKVDRP